MTNVYIFLDTTWPYYMIVDYVSYVVQRLNVNPYASTVTLLAASDGAIMVDTTNYLSDFFANWTVASHSEVPAGFSLPIILSTVRDLVEAVMYSDRETSSLGGQSLIALLMPSPLAYVSEGDHNYCMRFLAGLNQTEPDLHFLYFAGGAVIRFKDFVANSHEDLFPLILDVGVERSTEPVVQRIWEIPRRVVNPRCGADWCAPSAGTDQMVQYLRLGSINFYRMAPNYFYGYVSMRYLRVVAVSAISYTICTSRSIPLPHRNGSSDPPGQQCSQITTNAYGYDLTDPCAGYSTIQQCPPLFLSVQAQSFADASQLHCTDPACQTPDQAEFAIVVNNLNCNGGMGGTFRNCLNLIFALILLPNLLP